MPPMKVTNIQCKNAKPKDKPYKSMVQRAYDRAKFLDERKIMMQDWADYIDNLM